MTIEREGGTAPAAGHASWDVVIAEVEAAGRSADRAARSAAAARQALEAIRTAAGREATVAIARTLSEGPGGGALGALSALVIEVPAGGLNASARLALESLCAALKLEQRFRPGERLELDSDGFAGVDVQNEMPDEGTRWRCVVVQPGWLIDGELLARPVVVVEDVVGEEPQ